LESLIEYVAKIIAGCILTGSVALVFGIIGKALWEYFRKDKIFAKIDFLIVKVNDVTAKAGSIETKTDIISTIAIHNQGKIEELIQLISSMQIKHALLDQKVSNDKIVNLQNVKMQ